jgi:MOSC domain-containing protein YiiM
MGAMPEQAKVHSINVSNGGVPKLPRSSAHIRAAGVEDDRQANRRYHGGPDRAVSLFSQERIDALRAEGHPIKAGSIGENLTLSGVDWTRLAPGVRLQIGDVVLEVTQSVPPCRKIAGSFHDGRFDRVSDDENPGWGRYYCRVLSEGRIAVGDGVAVLRDEA